MAEKRPNAKRKILYGICGIGTGHMHRQMPIIEHFVSLGDRLVIFAYGESLAFYGQRFAGHATVTVIPVSVPFYVGNKEGIDFAATAALEKNRALDHEAINSAALARAQELLGKPDLVISDYEPVSARYAYGTNCRLVTIDQQSKYLVGDFPDNLNGLSCKDEIARLRLFFPRATGRIACSFFQVKPKLAPGVKPDPLSADPMTEDVLLYPAILKDSIVALKRHSEEKNKSILVYISSQQDFVQELAEVVRICAGQSEAQFHIFLPRSAASSAALTADLGEGCQNVQLYRQGDGRFMDVLSRCSGIVTTAGHTLLSEAMHLGIPAYVIPLPLYEQAMNGHVIDQQGFGICRPRLSSEDLSHFLAHSGAFAAAIAADRDVLLRGQGKDRTIEYLENVLRR